jgi:hypothetical protein
MKAGAPQARISPDKHHGAPASGSIGNRHPCPLPSPRMWLTVLSFENMGM